MRLSVIFLVQTLIVVVCLVAIVVTFMLVATNSVNTTVKVAVKNDLYRLSSEINLTIAVVEPSLQTARYASDMFQQEFWRYTTDGYPLEYFNTTIGWMASMIASQPSWMYLYQSYQGRPAGGRRISHRDAPGYFSNENIMTSASIAPPGNVTWYNVIAAQDGTLMFPDIDSNYYIIPDQAALGEVRTTTNLSSIQFDATENMFQLQIRHLRVRHAASGYWQGPQLWYDGMHDRQQPLGTFSLPISFDANTGFAVNTWNVDLNLQFITDLLARMVSGSRTNGFLVDTRDRKLIATSHQAKNDTVAYNATDPNNWQPWQLPRTPYPLLNTAWNEMCKATAASGYDCNGPSYTYPNELPPSTFDPARLGEVVYTTTATDLIAAVHIQRPATSLDWLAISITPSDYYLGEFQLASGVLIAVAVLVVVICVALSVLTYIAVVWPLQAMMEQMGKVSSSLREEEVVESPRLSTLTEVSAIQVRYMELKAHLRKVCSYLPPAIVATLLKDVDTKSSEECENQEPHPAELLVDDEGSVSDVHSPMTINSSTSTVHSFMKEAKRASNVAGLAAERRASMTDPNSSGGVGVGPGAAYLGTVDDNSGRSTAVISKPVTSSSSGVPNHGQSAPSQLKDAMLRLESQLSFMSKRVTILVINIRDFHKAASGMLQKTMTDALVGYMKLLSHTADEYRGVMHSVHGDHAVLTFNASSRCSNHGQSGVLAAYSIAQRFGGVQQGTMQQATLTMGISTGVATVGQCGTDTMKQLAVIGDVYKSASLLERLSKLHSAEAFAPSMRNHRVLMDIITAVAAEAVMYIRAVGVYPHAHTMIRGSNSSPRGNGGGAAGSADDAASGSSRGGTGERRSSMNGGGGAGAVFSVGVASTIHDVIPVSNERSRADGDGTEWMYEMRRAQALDPHKELNATFRRLRNNNNNNTGGNGSSLGGHVGGGNNSRDGAQRGSTPAVSPPASISSGLSTTAISHIGDDAAAASTVGGRYSMMQLEAAKTVEGRCKTGAAIAAEWGIFFESCW